MKTVKKSPLRVWFLRSARILQREILPTLKVHLVQHFQRNRLWFFLVAWTVVLVVGYVGFYKRLWGHKDYFSLSWETKVDLIYLTLQLFTLETNALAIGPEGYGNLEFELARLTAPFLAAFSVAQALEAIIRGRMPRLKGHVVICGAGRKGILLARAFQTCRLRVVVIEKNAGSEVLADCPGHVILGNATEREILERARVDTARYVICVCSEDGDNAQIASHVKDITRQRQERPLTCFVHIVDPRLRDQLERRERSSRVPGCRLYFFNILKSGARSLLYEFSPFEDTPTLPSRHVMVVGVGALGESLVVRAAEMWQHRQGTGALPLPITMLDVDAENKRELLLAQNPGLDGVWDLRAIQMDVRTRAFDQAAFLFDERGQPVPSVVYVCLGSDSLTLSASLLLRERLAGHKIRVVACMTQDSGLASLLRDPDETVDDRTGVATFGLMDRTCQPALLFEASVEDLAQAHHQEWARQQHERAHAEGRTDETPTWEDLPEQMKDSNRQQADSLVWKLQSVGYVLAPRIDPNAPPAEFASMEDVDKIAQMEHERWRAERMRQGWSYGPIRDNPKKQNPLLRAWDELTEEEKESNRRTVRGYPKLLASVDLQLYRPPRRKSPRGQTRAL